LFPDKETKHCVPMYDAYIWCIITKLLPYHITQQRKWKYWNTTGTSVGFLLII